MIPMTPARRRSRPAVIAACLVVCLAGSLTACVSSSSTTAAAPPLSAGRIAEIVASSDRSSADRTNDARRKPVQLLAFIGVRPGMSALDVSAGGGYTSELLARAIGSTGVVYGQSPPRDPAKVQPAPAQAEGASHPSSAAEAAKPAATAPRTSAMALAERAQKLRAAGIDSAMIVPVAQRFDDPVPAVAADGRLDLVTLMFNYHDLGFLGVDRLQMNRAIFRALKPGGSYVIADHAGRPGTGISESGTLHRIDEAFLRSEVEAVGFRLAGSADFLRNPNDPRDRNTPEPPQPKDEFVLKFVKP